MLEVERGGCIARTEGMVGHLSLVLGNLPLSRVLGNLPPFSPCSVCPQLSPCACAGTQACVGRVARSEHEQMQGGTCAGLGLQQHYICNFFIYTHNQFIISGQNFISCMGRFGLRRDINSKASGKYERALYVESNSVRLQYTTVVFPSLRVSAWRRLCAASSAWAAASAACGWAAVARASRLRCTDASAALRSLTGVYGARGTGCIRATAVPLCEGKAGTCAVWLFSPGALSIHSGVLPRSGDGGDGAGPDLSGPGGLAPCQESTRSSSPSWTPAAPAGPQLPREHPGMLGSLLALEMWGAGSMLPPCQFGPKFPWELMKKIKKCISL